MWRKILDWENTSVKQVEISFKPALVLLQEMQAKLLHGHFFPWFLPPCDYVAPVRILLVCLLLLISAMRDAMHELNVDPNKINTLVRSTLTYYAYVSSSTNRVFDSCCDLSWQLGQEKEYVAILILWKPYYIPSECIICVCLFNLVCRRQMCLFLPFELS